LLNFSITARKIQKDLTKVCYFVLQYKASGIK